MNTLNRFTVVQECALLKTKVYMLHYRPYIKSNDEHKR